MKSIPSHHTSSVKAVLVSLVCLFHALAVCAQPSLLPFASTTRNLSTTDGLPSNTVRNLVQDDMGFIWMGTDGGLCRYDGVVVRNFPIPHLRDPYVSALCVAADGILVGTPHGLWRLRYADGHYEPVDGKAADGTAITSMVSGIRLDADSVVWIATQGQGVFALDRRGALTHYNLPEVRNRVVEVYVDRDQQVWALTNAQPPFILRLDKARHCFVDATPKNAPQGMAALRMLQSHDGRRWLGGWNHGLVELQADGHMRQVAPQLEHIHSLTETRVGKLLVGCDAGIYEIDLQDAFLKPAMVNGSSNNFVYDALQDHEGGLWIASFYNAVDYISPFVSRFERFSCPLRSDDRQGSIISRFCEDQQGRVWMASDNGGLLCFSPSQGKCVDFASRQQLRQLNAHALAMDGPWLWVGSYSADVYKVDTRTGNAVLVKEAPQSTYALLHGDDGLWWMGTMDGVVVGREENGVFAPLSGPMTRSLGAIVIDIKRDRRGWVWVATQGAGVHCYRPGERRWYDYRASQKKGSLTDDQVNTICEDARGRIIIGTASGAMVYDAKTNGFSSMKLPVQQVNGIIDDGNALWMSTDGGVVRMAEGEAVQRFNTHDGLVSDQFLANSALMTADGKIYFGSVRGFSAFFPYGVKINKTMPRVMITGVDIWGKPVEVGGDRLSQCTECGGELHLNADDQMVTLSFAALSYAAPQKNLYAYRLEGFDKEWISVGEQHKATYTNLPAGTYTFRVRATNNDGIWSNQEATLTIVVHPPFYWSWPARLAYVLLCVLAIWLFVRWRLRRAERRHQREIRIVRERQEQEIREARLSFFTTIAHEIRTPVSLIIGPLEEYISKHSADDTLQMIDRNAHRLLELVNQLLDFNKVEHGHQEMRMEPCHVAAVLRSVTERFAPTLKQRGVTLQVNLPAASFVAMVAREGLTKVVSNLMNNATKYTRSLVTLTCVVDEANRQFTISVSDDGEGIAHDEQKKIFGEFYQARDNKPGTGIGLSIVKRIVDAHKGRVSVESEPGHGATFLVELPIGDVEKAQVLDPAASLDHLDGSRAAAEGSSPSAYYDQLATVQHDGDGNELAQTINPSTVLLVDDDADMLAFLRHNFESDYRVLTASDGVEALDVLSQEQVALIVSDWMMPNMDGAELCRHIRTDALMSHIPFVLLTAKTDDQSKTEGMVCGADVYIEKPFAMSYLKACIANMLDIRRRLYLRFSSSAQAPITTLSAAPVDNELLKQMDALIHEYIDSSELNVNFLADHMGLSRSTLYNKIKAIAGVTPNEMIQTVRLKEAATMLAGGQMRVVEVCYAVGFSSPSYFARCFQKQFGVRPTDYKGVENQS